VAYRLLNSRSGTSGVGVTSSTLEQKRNREARMDFGVVLIIANSLLAAFIYFILNWLWQD
jgi:hypothetical protein